MNLIEKYKYYKKTIESISSHCCKGRIIEDLHLKDHLSCLGFNNDCKRCTKSLFKKYSTKTILIGFTNYYKKREMSFSRLAYILDYCKGCKNEREEDCFICLKENKIKKDIYKLTGKKF